MRTYKLNCAHCEEPIELHAMDFCALNSSFGQYDCSACGKKNSLPDKESKLASLALFLFVFGSLPIFYELNINFVVTCLFSIAIGSYASILVARRADHLTKHVDQLYTAKIRPLYQNILIYIGIPALFLVGITLLLFKYGSR